MDYWTFASHMMKNKLFQKLSQHLKSVGTAF